MDSIEKAFNIKIDNYDNFQLALTHPSYTKENELSSLLSYERIEFLGDSVLKLYISDILYKKYSNLDEGELSKIRSIVISDAILSQIMDELNLSKLIRLGKGAEKSGDREKISVKACTFESLLGAYYLDNKEKELYVAVKNIFENWILEVQKNKVKYHSKETLQEYTQSISKKTPQYILIGQSGPAHAPEFEVEVVFENKVLAKAKGKSKKEAEQKCAYQACIELGVINEQ